jgi:hypothetical protein
LKVQVIRSVSQPKVEADGERLVTHGGVGMLAEIADLSGLTAGLSGLIRAGGHQSRRHDPGVTLVRAAAAIADGMSNVSMVNLFCGSRPQIFERASSRSTLARTIFAFGDELMPVRLDEVLRDARSVVWAKAGYTPKALVLDVDATLLDVHSEKQSAAPNYKGGYGFHPLGMWLDESREPLAMMLRPGNAGANNGDDHCDVLMRSIDQLPVEYQTGHQLGDSPGSVVHAMLVRADSAGASKQFLRELTDRNIEFSVGFHMTEPMRTLISAIPAEAWIPAINTDGTVRRGAHIVEVCGFTANNGWPNGSRLICRREEPHPGASLTLFDQQNGYRHTLMLTNTTGDNIAELELRHRQHARVEDRIRCWKTTGACRQPSWDAPANQAWLNTSLLGLTLIAWAQKLGFTGELAKAEPPTFRTRVLHIAAQHATRQRHLHLHLDRTWPWAKEIATAYTRIRTAFAVP